MIPAAAQQVNGGARRATWFEGFGRYVNIRKCVTFGMDAPNVGPDLPTVLTLFVDFAKPGLPARTQGQLGLDGKPAPRDALRNGPFGRIGFSHCDLAGTMDHRNAFIESESAVSQLLDRVLI